MKEVHFFDLDNTLWHTSAKWWIIDKRSPKEPIIKIDPHIGSSILSGVWSSQGHKIEYNGVEGWLSQELWLKIQKKGKIEAGQIGLSWREYTDSNLIKSQASDIKFFTHHINHLKGINTNIYLLTARGNKAAHQLLLNKLEKELDGICSINGAWFINDPSTFKILGNTGLKKTCVLLQSLIGWKIEAEQFKPIQTEEWDICHFYDDEDANILAAKDCNRIIKQLLLKTEPGLKQKIIQKLSNKVLNIHHVCSNEINPFISNTIKLLYTE